MQICHQHSVTASPYATHHTTNPVVARPSAVSQHGVVVARRPSSIQHTAGAASASAGIRQRRFMPPRASLTPEGQAVTRAAEIGLGLAGLSFVGTFFVAPQFKAAFKEDKDWRDIYAALTAPPGGASSIKALEPADAYSKSSSGQAVLLDVRLSSKYEASHAEACLSGPLYLPIQNWDVPSIIRRAGFAFFGIYGTELNTNFAEEVVQRVPKGKQIIVLCETGGSLENKSGTKFGFQSRSLKAVYYLQQAGYSKVSYVKGGLPAWVRAGLPTTEGPEDLEAVPALRPGADDDEAGGSDDENGSRVLGAFKLPQFKLPQLSFGSAARR